MQNTIKQIFLAGAGLVSIGKDKAEKIAKELVKRGELAMKDQDKFVDDLLKKAEKAKKNFDKNLESTIKSVLKKLDLPSKKDINALKKEVEKLKAELKELKKKKK